MNKKCFAPSSLLLRTANAKNTVFCHLLHPQSLRMFVMLPLLSGRAALSMIGKWNLTQPQNDLDLCTKKEGKSQSQGGRHFPLLFASGMKYYPSEDCSHIQPLEMLVKHYPHQSSKFYKCLEACLYVWDENVVSLQRGVFFPWFWNHVFIEAARRRAITSGVHILND